MRHSQNRLNRREFVAGACRRWCCGAAASLAGQSAPKKPNLVYVFADKLRYSSCGYAGDEYARTPTPTSSPARAATCTRRSRPCQSARLIVRR